MRVELTDREIKLTESEDSTQNMSKIGTGNVPISCRSENFHAKNKKVFTSKFFMCSFNSFSFHRLLHLLQSVDHAIFEDVLGLKMCQEKFHL